MMRNLLVMLLAVASLAAADSYDSEIRQWRAQRRTRLTANDSWLTLVGLYWLRDGVNNITLPTHPPTKARFVLQNGRVTLQPNTALRDDTDPKGPTILRKGTVSYEVIKRADVGSDRFGIRVKDSESEARKNFKGLDYFPANPAFRVQAHFQPYNPPKKIPIANVLGMTSDEASPGALVFTLAGKTFRIDPILEQGEKDFFIIFKDATSGKETYGAARYLYAHPPDANGNTIVDFNKSYNPPCVFTPYATCPLPPPQNRLPIRIEAGEKKYAGHA